MFSRIFRKKEFKTFKAFEKSIYTGLINNYHKENNRTFIIQLPKIS